MSKPSKTKKDKVPRLTEAEYANYVNRLKTIEQESVSIPQKEQKACGVELKNE